jgi:hypothetical protein
MSRYELDIRQKPIKFKGYIHNSEYTVLGFDFEDSQITLSNLNDYRSEALTDVNIVQYLDKKDMNGEELYQYDIVKTKEGGVVYLLDHIGQCLDVTICSDNSIYTNSVRLLVGDYYRIGNYYLNRDLFK